MEEFRIGKIKIPMKRMAVYAAVLFVLSVIPLLLLGKYNVMCVDDYDYGRQVYDTYCSTGSLSEAVHTAWKQNLEFYQNWQGTYVSCFLMALCPMNFNYKIAWVVPVLMIAALSCSTFLLGKHILRQWIGLEKEVATFVMCLLLFLFYQVMEAPFEGMYWYNGATHYVLLQSVFFLMIAAASVGFFAQKKGKSIVLCLLASVLAGIVGGGNLVTGLQAEIIMVLLIGYAFVVNRKKIWAVLVPFLCGSAGFLVNILAPGNTMRAAADTDVGYSAVVSVVLSFYNGIVFAVKWTTVPVVLIWILLLPVLWKAVGKSEKEFKYPVLVTLGAYCILSAMFTPTLYAVGMVGLSRVDNIIQMVYYLLVLTVTVYWLGYANGRSKKGSAESENAKAFDTWIKQVGDIVSMVCFILLIVVILFTPDKNTYHSVSAVRSIVNGEAKVFYEESMERHEQYVDPLVTDVMVKPYSRRPALFAVEDLSEDPGNWLNLAVTQYFHKNSVRKAGE